MSRARDLADGTFSGAFSADSPTLVVDDTNNFVGIGTASPTRALHVNSGTENYAAHFESTDTALNIQFQDSTGTVTLETRDDFRFKIDSDIDMMLNNSGNLLVGTTSSTIYNSSSSTTAGAVVINNSTYAAIQANNDGGAVAIFNRTGTEGSSVQLRTNGASKGYIGIASNRPYFANHDNVGLLFVGDDIRPCDSSGVSSDNTIDLGDASYRFDDIYASSGTVNSSDATEKQSIASLTDAEITAAKAISKLFKTYKWNSAVETKGDAARTHSGVIAQEVQQAMSDAGLDAAKYGFWCSNTWWETQTEVPAVEAVDEVVDEDGNVVTEAVEAKEAYTRTDTYDTAEEAPEGATERTRLGIRYPELLSFVGAATEQRLASIEARLDALEAV